MMMDMSTKTTMMPKDHWMYVKVHVQVHCEIYRAPLYTSYGCVIQESLMNKSDNI